MTEKFVQSDPYPWPYNGDLRPQNTGLLVIDMQHDFCSPGGFIDRLKLPTAGTHAIIPTVRKVLEAMRAGGFHIIHTREGHRPDGGDLQPNKAWRAARAGVNICANPGPCGMALTRGEPGWQIVPELTPLAGEPIIDKPGKGAFHATDLDTILQQRGIRNLVFTGVTTDVCVHTTLREANDRGYECLLLEDCCAAINPASHAMSVWQLRVGAIFGTVTTSDKLIAGISA
jgi:nicotinamidase-related amidase